MEQPRRTCRWLDDKNMCSCKWDKQHPILMLNPSRRSAFNLYIETILNRETPMWSITPLQREANQDPYPTTATEAFIAAGTPTFNYRFTPEANITS